RPPLHLYCREGDGAVDFISLPAGPGCRPATPTLILADGGGTFTNYLPGLHQQFIKGRYKGLRGDCLRARGPEAAPGLPAEQTRMYTPLTRRDALKTLGAFSAGGALGALALWSSAKSRQVVGPKGGVLRLAHLTDVHVRPGNRSGAGLAACLRHVQALD